MTDEQKAEEAADHNAYKPEQILSLIMQVESDLDRGRGAVAYALLDSVCEIHAADPQGLSFDRAVLRTLVTSLCMFVGKDDPAEYAKVIKDEIDKVMPAVVRKRDEQAGAKPKIILPH